jgi:hypothetical protein
MSVALSMMARWRHNLILTWSPSYRRVHERLREISQS